MAQEILKMETQFLEEIKKNSGLTIAVGVIVFITGLLAMGSPFVAGLSILIVVGAMLIISGIFQLVFAFKTSKPVFALILGLLNIIIGGYMVGNPGVALEALTIFLAIYFIISGISDFFMSFHTRSVKGWGWALFSGGISVLLGGMIWSQFPLSGATAIGILIGVRLLFSGWTLLMFGFGTRDSAKVQDRKLTV